jgi:predicted Rossmann fold nucleotide-binding protein DprA/Smf involved in DNA uptake
MAVMKEEKKIAIIGSRDFKNKRLVDETMKPLLDRFHITYIVSGGAKGADTLGVQWANKHNIPTKVHYPDFKKRKRAYHFRNRLIVQDADIVVAFWNTHSTGTKYTMNYAKSLEKELIVIKY